MESKIQFNHIYRPTYFFLPFIAVFILWNLVIFGGFARLNPEQLPRLAWMCVFIFVTTNWVLFDFPLLDPTSSYSISEGFIVKYSYLPFLIKKIKMNEIKSVEYCTRPKVLSYYLVQSQDKMTKFRIINSVGTEELCLFLQSHLKNRSALFG